MIDVTVIDKAVKLKKEMDAAYLVFKKLPTIEASAKWTSATRAYNDYCVSVMTELVKERIDLINYREDISKNFDKYSKCDKCGAELLFPAKTSTEGDTEVVEDFIASSDFVEGFPGWCYPCLVEYCTTHACEGCTVSKTPTNCMFAEVKKLHQVEEA